MSRMAAAEVPQERWPETSEAVTAADGAQRRRWWTLAALAGAVVALAFLPARAKPRSPELPPMCDPALNPSCARPLAGLSFLGRRSQPSSSEHNTDG
jgi:hypothetical protein